MNIQLHSLLRRDIAGVDADCDKHVAIRILDGIRCYWGPHLFRGLKQWPLLTCSPPGSKDTQSVAGEPFRPGFTASHPSDVRITAIPAFTAFHPVDGSGSYALVARSPSLPLAALQAISLVPVTVALRYSVVGQKIFSHR